MKTLKSKGVLTAVILIAAFGLGAMAVDDSRPTEVPFERWIPMGDNAGLVVQSGVTQPGEDVAVQLYIMTNGQWRRARVVNPIVVAGFGN